MKDMEAVRANEKLKRASTLLGAGGLALLAAGISRWYTSDGLDLQGVLWIVIAAALIWGSVQMNDWLESEEA